MIRRRRESSLNKSIRQGKISLRVIIINGRYPMKTIKQCDSKILDKKKGIYVMQHKFDCATSGGSEVGSGLG